MTGTKRKMNKLFVITLIAIITCTLAGIFSLASPSQTHAYVDASIDAFERSVIASRYTPTIEDDFKDDRIIVTLKSQHSEVNRRAEIQSFRTSEHSVAFDEVEDLTYITDTSKIINKEEFSQIFSITLQEHGKENVLRAIEQLEKLDHVLAAEPDYNFIAVDDWASNDTRYNE